MKKPENDNIPKQIPTDTLPEPEEKESIDYQRSNKKTLIILGAAILILLIIGAVIFFFNNHNASSDDPSIELDSTTVTIDNSETLDEQMTEERSIIAETCDGTVYEGKIGNNDITMIIDEYGNGKYFYNKYGNATENFLLLYNYNGSTRESKLTTSPNYISLTEFDKDLKHLGELYFEELYFSHENEAFSGRYWSKSSDKSYDITFKVSTKTVNDIDPNFKSFIEKYLPAMKSAYQTAFPGDVGDIEECVEENSNSINSNDDTLAKFKADKNEIFLMPKGKITSSNPNIKGNWKELSPTRYNESVYQVLFGDQRYDGEILYVIIENEAYKLTEGNCGPYIEDGTCVQGHISVKFEYEIEGSEIFDLSEITSIPVHWQ